MKRLVFHMGRLERCDARILDFFRWWDESGPFPLTIPPSGGLRLDEVQQAGYYLVGKSKARTLAETPHGRGGAADAYPAVMDPSGTYVASVHLDGTAASARLMFIEYGELAEARGLEWGGRFHPIEPSTGLGWDLPHVQVPGWTALPFPPLPPGDTHG